jgi:hypothetical protein
MRDGSGLARERAARRAARRADERPHDPRDQRESRLVRTAQSALDAIISSRREGRDNSTPRDRVTPEEQAARATIEDRRGIPFTDEEWAVIKGNLRAFGQILILWESAQRTDGDRQPAMVTRDARED